VSILQPHSCGVEDIIRISALTVVSRRSAVAVATP